MSTLKVNKIENTGTTDGGIEIDSDGHVQVDGIQMPTSGPLSNRNLIINGAMQVAQRGTSVTNVSSSGYRTCDRILYRVAALGVWTVEQSTDAPDGFSNSFKATCTTADSSPAAAGQVFLDYRAEGQDLQRLFSSGTTTHPLTLSFWVKSNKTGNASVNLLQSSNSDRMFATNYNISAANTWEHKTISIPADTAAAFNNTNGQGLSIFWFLNSGSDFTGSAQNATWQAFDGNARNNANLGVGGAVNDNFFITGIQLEVGDKATPFEHRSFGDELNRCKRYFSILSPGFEAIRGATGTVYSTANLQSFMQLPPMRVMPTLSDPDGNSTVVMSGRTSTFTVSGSWNLLPFGVNNQPNNMLVGFSYNNANNSGTNLATSEVFLVLTEQIYASAEL